MLRLLASTGADTKPINQGRFVWHDLSTTDIEGAKEFYGAIAPWTSKPWDDDGDFFLWENAGTPVGGVMRLSGLADMTSDGVASLPRWLPSVYVYDVDACARQVPKLGGRVLMQPREIPHVGCWAIITGPEGAPLSIFEPSSASPPGHEGQPRVGEFAWHELMSNDWQASLRFFGALFNWEKIDQHDMGSNGTYVIFGQKNQRLGGMFNGRADVGQPSWTSYVEVPSVKEVTEKVKSLGGTVVREPHEVPGGSWIALCADPQGATFALTSQAR
jgi:predicted enzyme related to lactoylglutathione lyase